MSSNANQPSEEFSFGTVEVSAESPSPSFKNHEDGKDSMFRGMFTKQKSADSEITKPKIPASIGRQKMVQERGFTQVDWMRLVNSGADLSGLNGKPLRKIKLDEVALHKSKEDCWTVLYGRVYNIGPYLNYHPGGVKILMLAAGKDCTELFNKYHKWVNFEYLLSSCLVGILDKS